MRSCSVQTLFKRCYEEIWTHVKCSDSSCRISRYKFDFHGNTAKHVLTLGSKTATCKWCREWVCVCGKK